MKQETKGKLIKYAICFGVEVLIAFIVIWIKGFFNHPLSVNIQILADAFFVAGIFMTLFAGMIFISGEGGLIGIGYVLRNVILAFIPMGRMKHEKYADYRARKLARQVKIGNGPIIITGLFFLTIGIILTIVWYVNFFDPSVIS